MQWDDSQLTLQVSLTKQRIEVETRPWCTVQILQPSGTPPVWMHLHTVWCIHLTPPYLTVDKKPTSNTCRVSLCNIFMHWFHSFHFFLHILNNQRYSSYCGLTLVLLGKELCQLIDKKEIALKISLVFDFLSFLTASYCWFRISNGCHPVSSLCC